MSEFVENPLQSVVDTAVVDSRSQIVGTGTGGGLNSGPPPGVASVSVTREAADGTTMRPFTVGLDAVGDASTYIPNW